MGDVVRIGEQVFGEFMRHADADRTAELARRELGDQFIVERQDAAGIGLHHPARVGDGRAAVLPFQQGLADEVTGQVVRLRGLPLKRPLAKGVLSKDQIRARLKERVRVSLKQRARGGIWRACSPCPIFYARGGAEDTSAGVFADNVSDAPRRH